MSDRAVAATSNAARVSTDAEAVPWAGVIVACRGTEWQVAPEPGFDGLVADQTDGVAGNWWASFQRESRWRDRDVQDTAEALSKCLGGLRIESMLPWESHSEEQHREQQRQPDRDQDVLPRLSEWVHWARLCPRQQQSSVVVGVGGARVDENSRWLVVESYADTDSDDYSCSHEAQALSQSGVLALAPAGAQMETGVECHQVASPSSSIERGELGLAVESGGPLGQMRYATGAPRILSGATSYQAVGRVAADNAATHYGTSGGAVQKGDVDKDNWIVNLVETPGHGQPGKRWVGLAGVANDGNGQGNLWPALTPVFHALLSELQQPPVLPTLRRNLETLSFYFCRSGSISCTGGQNLGSKQTSQLVLVFGYRDRGRGRAQRTNAVVSPPQNSTTLHAVSSGIVSCTHSSSPLQCAAERSVFST